MKNTGISHLTKVDSKPGRSRRLVRKKQIGDQEKRTITGSLL
jgi:hypothetical protein